MKKITTKITRLAVCLVFAFTATTQYVSAVPAYPYPIKHTLPDGSTITIQGHGDERVSWVTSTDGYTLLLNDEGFYEYATLSNVGNLVCSGIRAKDENVRTVDDKAFIRNIRKDLRYSDEQIDVLLQFWSIKNRAIQEARALSESGDIQQAFTGSVKAPVILVDFPNKSFTKTQDDFRMLINQPNYTNGGEHNGSVRDFFYNSSYEQLEFSADIYGPYRMANNIPYYDHKSSGGDPRKMAREAINAAAADGCNFANYDMDGDGVVEVVHIIYAGYGQEATQIPGSAVWAHKSGLSPAVSVHGKYIYEYSCSPELRSTTGTNITYIGVIAHELSHVFGLPDFYNTRTEETVHTGPWDIMASGSWNNNGRTPADHNPWSKAYLGWANVQTLEIPADITISRPRDEKVIYRIDTKTANEYFLVENRQREDQDAYVPASGMLIYHVDENYYGWDENEVNAHANHRGMYIKQANGGINSTNNNPNTRNTDVYPYGSNNSFTDISVPNSKSWAGVETGKPITDITHNTSDRTVSFKFKGGAENAATVSLSANPAGGGTVSGAGTYEKNRSATVTATANTNYDFIHWTYNNTIVSTNSTYSFTVTEDVALVANFADQFTVLNNITVSEGTLQPVFNKHTYEYSVVVDNAITQISVNGTTDNIGATVSGNVTNMPLNVGTNTVQLVVDDGVTNKTYTVTVIRKLNPASEQNISLLWNANDFETKSFTIKATSGAEFMVNWGDQGAADVYVGNGTTSVAISHQYSQRGDYQVDIKSLNTVLQFTYLDINNTATERLTINAALDLETVHCYGNRQLLSNLYDISQAITLPADKLLGTQTAALKTVDLNSTVTLQDIIVGGTPSVITVKKGNNTAVENTDYTLIGDQLTFLATGDFTVEMTNSAIVSHSSYPAKVILPYKVNLSNDATLQSLTVNYGILTPAFNPNITNYTVNVDMGIYSINVTGVANYPNAQVTGNVTNKVLVEGNNVINIVVTAENGTTTKTYKVTVVKSALNDATLKSINLSSGTLTPTFNRYVTNYTVKVPNNVTSIDVSGVPNQAAASVTGNITGMPLVVGPNNVTLQVTSENGAITKDYTITITRISSMASSDAALQNLTVSEGTLTPAFSPTETSYTVTVPVSVTSITVTGTANHLEATVTGNVTNKALNIGNNPITIVVTAEDLVTAKTYTVNVIREGSTDATLSGISVSEGILTPAFNANITDYTVNVENNITSINVIGIANHTGATVMGNVTGKALVVGNNVVTITVTAEDGTTTKTYTVTIIRAASADATLSGITVSEGVLTPVFDANTTSYTVSVENSVTSINVTGTANHANATTDGNVTDKALVVGNNVVTITVTAEDGTTTKTYTVTVIRIGSNDATLSDLAVSKGILTPAFNVNVTSYTVDVEFGVTEIDVTGVANHWGATVAGNVTNKPLATGDNTATITVTAEDGTTTKTYTVVITRDDREIGTEAELLELKVNSSVITGTQFMADCGVTSVTLDITASPYATVKVNNAVYDGGAIPLSGDKTTINIEITAEDGVAVNTYSLVVAAPLDGSKLYYQRWSDVLAVNNNPSNNGGYNVAAYRWYKKGSSSVISTNGYIQIQGSADDYYAEIQLKETGEWHKVCSAQVIRSSMDVIAYPNPVSEGEILRIQIPKEYIGGEVSIYNMSGSIVKSKIALPSEINAIDTRGLALGIYFLHVAGKNGGQQTVKVIVN